MNPFDVDQDLIDSVASYLQENEILFPLQKLPQLVGRVKEEILKRYVERLIHQVETILDIDPLLAESEILQTLARNVAQFLGADFASIRLYDPGKEGSEEDDLQEPIPFERGIGDEVVHTQQSYFVPDISREPKYQNRKRAGDLGIHSLLAVPFRLPRFSPIDGDTQGVLQIFYRQQDKPFPPMEVQIAETLSRRVGYVIARKRIHSLQKISMTRDKILEDIYLRLARREGIKMKDVFDAVIPELADIMKIQRCTLFSVMEDREHVMLEAGFPGMQHGIGKIFSVKEAYIQALVQQMGPFGNFENEKIHPAYILIHSPQKSQLLPPHLKHYLQTQEINCVLYIPLRVEGTVEYFLAFDAQAQHRRFAEEEIMMFSFLGKELMKGLRLEKLDDILHDFKNPAIAIAGFSKRVQRLLGKATDPPQVEKIRQAMDVILKESSRIQALALTLHGEGKEAVLDLSETLRGRFLINQEAARELGRRNIHLEEARLESPLWIRCYPLHIERVLDNLLNNASQATPDRGKLSIRSYRKAARAIAEISNQGEIAEGEIERCLLGQARGRGLHITTRLIRHMGGKMEVESGEGQTTFRVDLPLASPPGSEEEPSPPA
jgi:signal transduction histidine kinase